MKYGELGQWECEVLMHQDSDYEKMHLYEVEKKQRNEKLNTETMRWIRQKRWNMKSIK